MSELLQTGQHPDADQLSAFIEHALPAHEHESVLAHLAICPDCRSVVTVSMPPVEQLPEVQPKPVRRPWFSGWNLVWPVAAAFAALILIAVLVHKGGGNATPAQIAEEHLPEQPAVSVGVAPAQSGSPAVRSAGPSPAGQDRSIEALQSAKATADKAPAGATLENQSYANLPLSGRDIQPPPPSAAMAPSRVMGGMGGGSASGLAQGTQRTGSGLSVQQPPSVGAGLPAVGAMTRPTAASAAPTAAPGTPVGAATSRDMVDATSDNALAVEASSNASSTVISGEALAALTSERNVALHPLPSGLPVLSVATAGDTMLALDSGNELFLSGDAGEHWKRVRAKWQGHAVKVALAVTPVALAQQPFPAKKAAIQGELQGRVSTASAAGPIAQTAAVGGAALTGQVTDPAGAVIPGASVTATNAATAAAVTVTTNAAGRYFADGLAPGTYRIDATARGFITQELTVTLAASQQERADLKLQVGQMTETVTVTNAPPLMETESTSLSAEIGKSKSKRGAPPVFAITTDAGVRWLSADGQSWKRE
jgi:hypothetical protein